MSIDEPGAATPLLEVDPPPTAEDEFVRRFGGVADRYARALARRYRLQPEDADDAVVEALLRAWRECLDGRPIGNDRSWLLAVVRRLLIDRARIRWRLSELDIEPEWIPDPSESPYTQVLRLALATRLRKGLKKLSAQQLLVIRLHYFENLTLTAVAALLEISESTAKTHRDRALIKLLKELDPPLRPDDKKRREES